MKKSSISEINNRAVELTYNGSYKEALSLFEEILKSEPENISVLYNYGFNFLKAGKKEKAIEVFDRIAAVGGAFKAPPTVVADCGTACYDEGLYDEAERYYLLSEKTDPENSSLQNHMGVLDFVRGNYKEAEKHFKTAVAYDENNIDSWFNLADTCEILGRVEESLKARKRFLELEKKQSD